MTKEEFIGFYQDSLTDYESEEAKQLETIYYYPNLKHIHT